jgi:hypothetical protein
MRSIPAREERGIPYRLAPKSFDVVAHGSVRIVLLVVVVKIAPPI